MGFLNWFRGSKDSRDYLVKRVPPLSYTESQSPSTHGTDDGHYGRSVNRLAESSRRAVGTRDLDMHFRRKVTKDVSGEGVAPLQRKLIDNYKVDPDAEYHQTMWSGSLPEELRDAYGIAADLGSIAIDSVELTDDPDENQRRVQEAGDNAIEGFARRLPWNRS